MRFSVSFDQFGQRDGFQKEKREERRDLDLAFRGNESKPARIASSKSVLSPSWVRAEHSMNLCAPKVSAKCWPSARSAMVWDLSDRLSRMTASSARSLFVATIRKGVPGQWKEISGYHFVTMASKLALFDTE